MREASRKWMIFYKKLTPIVYTSVRDSGVLLTMRYLTEPHHRRGRRQAIWEDVLRAFASRDDIDFAYPTQRFFSNVQEGKRPGPAPAGRPPVRTPGAPPTDAEAPPRTEPAGRPDVAEPGGPGRPTG